MGCHHVQPNASTAPVSTTLNGVELVAQKVHSLYVMGGKFGEDGNTKAGYNFGHKTAIQFSVAFFDQWPHSIPIYFSPSLPGDYLDYSPDDVLNDLSWIEANPIKQTYLNYDCNTGQRMCDVYPALMALTDVDHYLGNQSPGIVTITQNDNNDDGVIDYEMIYEETAGGYCHYQVVGDEASRTDDMAWIKMCNTAEASVSRIIYP